MCSFVRSACVVLEPPLNGPVPTSCIFNNNRAYICKIYTCEAQLLDDRYALRERHGHVHYHPYICQETSIHIQVSVSRDQQQHISISALANNKRFRIEPALVTKVLEVISHTQQSSRQQFVTKVLKYAFVNKVLIDH